MLYPKHACLQQPKTTCALCKEVMPYVPAASNPCLTGEQSASRTPVFHPSSVSELSDDAVSCRGQCQVAFTFVWAVQQRCTAFFGLHSQLVPHKLSCWSFLSMIMLPHMEPLSMDVGRSPSRRDKYESIHIPTSVLTVKGMSLIRTSGGKRMSLV